MAQHAKFSLSGSKRRYACPGSTVLEQPFPDTSNKYSADGTAMHEVARWCLTEHRRADLRIGQDIKVSEDGEPPEYVEFTDDMADLVQGYVDTVRMLGVDNLKFVEQRVDVSSITGIADQFGTLDFGYLDLRQGELGVIDLKTGYRPVSPVGNTQIMLYALGLLKHLVDGNLLAQREAAGAQAQPEAAGVAPAVQPNADDDGSRELGVVAGDAVQTAQDAQDQVHLEAEDDLW